MNFEWEYEVTPEVSKKVTKALLDMYEKHKDDEIFLKYRTEKNKNKKTS